ncbi:sodium:calcium antiporter [Mariprofundus ferrooxydans]|nr:sodium:calcium antiporter [Mariprofundus ferrooxydans]
MTATVMLLLLALGIVYLAAELFTNALEHIGERLGVSEGVTGSVFAAVGTAMPETIVPMVAILAGGAAESVNRDVGLGAILGAPFMLGTLSFGLMAFFAGRKRGWHARFKPESGGLNRDLRVFMLAFSLVIGAALLPEGWESAKIAFATALFLTYFLYVLKTIQASRALVDEGHSTEADSPLYVSRLLGDGMPAVVLQLLCGLTLLVVGARVFVDGVQQASALFGVSALVIALLVVPVATELPEKVNSILWIRRGRDTLAFGNITGAMVFQSTIIPAAGMLLMPWHFSDIHAAAAVLLAVLGVAWLWLISRASWFRPIALLLNAGLYLLFVAVVILY